VAPVVTNRQVIWAVFVGLVGFFVGGKVNGSSGAIVGAAWGASIGYGIGSIFSQKQAGKSVVIYWVGTLALFGPIPALFVAAVPRPEISDASLMLAGAAGALVGALVGLPAGMLQSKRLRRKAMRT
jgi:hypothetical protein